eukprot:gene1694-2039_t
MHSSILVVLSLLLLALKVTNADGVMDKLIGSANNAFNPLKAQKVATAAALLSSSSVVSPNYPTYPQATDYASGTCVGYAFCFANWNPPLLTEPDVMCPAGYEVTTNFGKPLSSCYPTWDSCDGDSSSSGNVISGLLQNIGSICKGSPAYSSIVDNVQLVEVTQGSRWYTGTTAGSTGSTGTTGMAGTTGMVGSTGMTGSNITVVDPNAEVQVVPAGSLVNIGGRLVRAQAQQQGTFIPSQSDGTSATGNGAAVMQIAPPGINPTLPPPTIAPGTSIPGTAATARFASKNVKKPNLKASNARKKADPTATEPWLPDIFGGSRRLTAAAAAGGYDSTDAAAMAAAAAAHAAQHAAPGVGSKNVVGAGSNKEALFLLPMLMMLPRLSLGGKPVEGSNIMAAKEVVMGQATSKADVVPRCFSKCCSSDADVVCVAAKQTVNYAKPEFMCPTGCSYTSAT